MKTSILSTKIILLFLIMLSLLSSLLSIGQQSAALPSDTVTKEIETVRISDISIRSGEVWTQTSRLYESLLSDEDIKQMKLINDSIVDNIKNLLKNKRFIDLKTKSVRYLNNKKVYWKKFDDVLETEKTKLVTNIKTLNKNKYNFEDEILIWKNTKNAIKHKNTDLTVVKRVNELISQLETVVKNVQKKSDKLLKMLDRTTIEGVTLVEYIDSIDNELTIKNSEIFVQNQPHIYSISYTNPDNWKFIEPIMFFYHVEVVELIKYVNDYFSYFIFQLLLIIFLIVVLNMVKKKLLETDINNNTKYEQMLRKIFSRNISAAIILGFFASIIIFPNRPELFKDIVVLIVTIPLIIITTTLVDRIIYKYLYLFGLAIYLKFIYVLFPPDNLYSTISMILVAIIEIFVLWKLTSYFFNHSFTRKLLKNLFILLTVVNLGFAIVGLVGVLYGATMLAEMTLDVPVTNFISAILVFITAIIFNGLIDVGIESKYFLRLNFVRLYGNHLRKQAIGIINFIAITFWVITILNAINIEKTIFDGITNFFTDDINVGSASFTLWNIVIFFVVIWLSVIIAKMTRILLEQDILNKVKLGKGVAHTVALMVRYSIITLGVLLALGAAGIPIGSLTVLFGAFGVGIGFGLQNIFNNIVSGFILLFERPIQIGDTIEVGQLELTGVVKSIGIRSSNIRTFDGAEVIVPNGHLISNEVVNWTLSDRRRRIELIAGVAYGSDPHQVRELLLKILHDHPEIIGNPEPIVLFNNLGESSLDFRMLFWISDSSDWILVRSEVVFSVHDELKKADVSIPFPQMDLHVKSVDKGVDMGNKKNL